MQGAFTVFFVSSLLIVVEGKIVGGFTKEKMMMMIVPSRNAAMRGVSTC